MFQATAEHVVRHGTAALRRNAEPAPGDTGILLDATAIEQNLPEQQLCLDHTLPRCCQDRLGRLAGAVFEHGLQAGSIYHFFTTQLIGHGSDLGPAAQQVVVGAG
jgi:hypothetical protein